MKPRLRIVKHDQPHKLPFAPEVEPRSIVGEWLWRTIAFALGLAVTGLTWALVSLASALLGGF